MLFLYNQSQRFILTMQVGCTSECTTTNITMSGSCHSRVPEGIYKDLVVLDGNRADSTAHVKSTPPDGDRDQEKDTHHILHQE